MLRNVLTGLTAFSLALAVGCADNESKEGGPGADKDKKETTTTTTTDAGTKAKTTTTTTNTDADDNTFTIEADDLTVTAGMEQKSTITLDKEDDFKQDVTLTFEAPKGITITPANATVSSAAEDTEITVAAAADATAGKHAVTVKAKPAQGKETSVKFMVEVKANE